MTERPRWVFGRATRSNPVGTAGLPLQMGETIMRMRLASAVVAAGAIVLFAHPLETYAARSTTGMVAQAGQGTSGTPKSAGQMLEELTKATKDSEQLKAALESPDPSTRVAAFNVMVNSGNPAYAELAITTAHASSDPTMRALAFRAAFKSVGVFSVNLVAPENATQKQREMLTFFALQIGEPIKAYAYETGKFMGRGSLQGSISGTAILFASGNCSGTLTNKESTWDFVGPVACTSGDNPTYLGTFSLR